MLSRTGLHVSRAIASSTRPAMRRSMNHSASNSGSLTTVETGPSYWTVNGQVCPFGEANFVHDPTGELYSSLRIDRSLHPQPRICMVYDKRELNVMPGSISFYAFDSTPEPGPYETSGEPDFV